MTTHGPIYQMVEERIVNLYGLDAQAEGNTDYISRCQELESLIPHIEEIEPVWIPVEERLPEDDREYLVITEHFNITVASCTGTSWFSYGTDGLYNMKHDSPTHWQPLPLPPTK